MGDIALRGNKLTKGRGPHGHGPKPFLNRPGQAQGTHGGKAKGGRIGKYQETYRPPQQKKSELQDFSRKRKELKDGGKPWGTGPKPGSHEFLMQNLHKRKGKAIGGAIKKVVKTIVDKVRKGKGKGEKGLGSGIKPSEMHEIIPKGDRKLYLKEKLANPHKRIGKAAGGRIGYKVDPLSRKTKTKRVAS